MISAPDFRDRFVRVYRFCSFVENSRKSVENSPHLWKTAIRRSPDRPHSFLTGKMTSNRSTSDFLAKSIALLLLVRSANISGIPLNLYIW